MRDKKQKTKKTHLELHGARDAELFDGDGKVEAEVLEVVGVEGEPASDVGIREGARLEALVAEVFEKDEPFFR